MPTQILGHSRITAAIAFAYQTALSRASSERTHKAIRTLDFVVFHLLAVRVERDRLLARDTLLKYDRYEARARARVRVPLGRRLERRQAKVYPVVVKLLSGIVQSLDQLADLDLLEADPDTHAKIETEALFARSERCPASLQECPVIVRI